MTEDRGLRKSHEYALELLERDPVSRWIPDERKPSLVHRALGIGYEAAVKVRFEHGQTDVFRLTRELGIGIEYDYEDRRADKWHTCTRYVSSPASIVVLEPLLRLYKEAASEYEVETNHLLPDALKLSVAHQVFHHLERLWVGFVSRMHMVDRLNLGLVKITRAVEGLSEIAASEFARVLLEVELSPIYVETLLRSRIEDGAGGRAAD